MNILYLSFMDFGGQGYVLYKGVNDFTPHKARHLVIERSYLDFPYDVWFPFADAEEVKEIIENTDFFHFKSGIIVRLGRISLENVLRKNNMLVHWSGSVARNNLAWILKLWLRDGIVSVCWADPTIREEIGSNFSIPYLIDFRDLPKPKRDPNKVRVCHAPTDRKQKGTQIFLKVMKEIEEKHPEVETVLIEKTPWRECLKIKSTCDITFDQISPYGLYGCSGIESMALGQPVVCSLSNYFLAMYPDCPVVRATEKNLKSVLEELVTDEDLRKYIGKKGIEFCRRVHGLEENINRWIYLYKWIMEERR